VDRSSTDDARRPALDDPSGVHDDDVVAEVAHHAEIMGDEQVAQSTLGLEPGEQVEDLCLHREVERADRLVADDELGVSDDRPCDRDPLALPTGEAPGEAACRRWVQTDLGQHVRHPGRGL
jgi:hypothetical protein